VAHFVGGGGRLPTGHKLVMSGNGSTSRDWQKEGSERGRGLPSRDVHLCSHVIVKLVPELCSVEGSAFTTKVFVTIVIWWTAEDVKEAEIEPVVPPIVAEAAVNAMTPKLARGSILPPTDGASAIHSAEDASAPDTVCEWVRVPTTVLPDFTVMVVVNTPVDGAKLVSAVTVSPAAAGNEA
jgi:hypothetical protein